MGTTLRLSLRASERPSTRLQLPGKGQARHLEPTAADGDVTYNHGEVEAARLRAENADLQRELRTALFLLRKGKLDTARANEVSGHEAKLERERLDA